MKRIIAILFVLILIFISGCSTPSETKEIQVSTSQLSEKCKSLQERAPVFSNKNNKQKMKDHLIILQSQLEKYKKQNDIQAEYSRGSFTQTKNFDKIVYKKEGSIFTYNHEGIEEGEFYRSVFAYPRLLVSYNGFFENCEFSPLYTVKWEMIDSENCYFALTNEPEIICFNNEGFISNHNHHFGSHRKLVNISLETQNLHVEEQVTKELSCKDDSDCFLKDDLPYHVNDTENPSFQYGRHEAEISVPIAYCNNGKCAIKFDCTRCSEFKDELDQACECPPNMMDENTGDCAYNFGTAHLLCTTYIACNC